MTRSRKTLFGLVLVVLLYAFFELATWGTLGLLSRWRNLEYSPVPVRLKEKHAEILHRLLDGEPGYLSYSASLGWEPRPGADHPYRISAQGLRGQRLFPVDPDPERLRIACFGDSYTFGADVADDETFEEQVMHLVPELEVLNFGVPAYGLDQAYLRYLEYGTGFRPDVVLIGFYTDNINRVVNVFRPYYHGRTRVPLAKPRFTVRGDRLALLDNPMGELDEYRELLDRPQQGLARLGRHDYFYRRKLRSGQLDVLPSVRLAKLLRQQYFGPIAIRVDGYFNPESEAYRVTEGLLDAFYSKVLDAGATPVIVMFPSGKDVGRFQEEGTRMYQPLVDHFERESYRYVDVAEVFASRLGSQSHKQLFRGHYNALGNRYVAEGLIAYLQANGLTTKP